MPVVVFLASGELLDLGYRSFQLDSVTAMLEMEVDFCARVLAELKNMAVDDFIRAGKAVRNPASSVKTPAKRIQ